jgi:FkbH-like protein
MVCKSVQNLEDTLRRLDKEPTYATYTAVSNAIDSVSLKESGLIPLRLAVLRNFTIDPIIPVIKGEMALSGFYTVVYLGGYDAISQDVFNDKSSLYEFKPDIIILAQWLETLSPLLTRKFGPSVSDQVNNEIERVLNGIDEFNGALRRNVNAPILINNFNIPSYPALGILDAQSENHQTQAILNLNKQILNSINQLQDVYLVDYMSLAARLGSEQGVDERYWQIGRAPIGRNALIPFGQEYGKFIRALNGKSRKCLILDCDNILWGGVVGEEGLDNIKLGEDYPGSCYKVFQQLILNLHDRGVILALCSKNNDTDVLEVLNLHPDMILREKNFSAMQINWEDKATNIIRIAQELNIGLDSLVFVDDSPFECDLVRKQLPQVAVLQLSSEPSTFSARLNAKSYFDTLTLSSEDRNRNKMYRAQFKRKQLYKASGSLEEFFAKLDMVVEIGLLDSTSIARISQLVQKTNQFNLTTHRHSEGNIRAFAESSEFDVFYIKLSDRIAEMGLIGVAIIKYDGKQADIETFLLSCRALGRGVEDAFMAQILNYVKEKECTSILGHYLASKKNIQVADFYGKQGFRLVSNNDGRSDWELLFDERAFSQPDWIKINFKK